jgi:hypothetical protein
MTQPPHRQDLAQRLNALLPAQIQAVIAAYGMPTKWQRLTVSIGEQVHDLVSYAEQQPDGLRRLAELINAALIPDSLSAPAAPQAFTPTPLQPEQKRTLAALRKQVETLVTQRLGQSLHQMVRVELGMREQPEQIADPWQRLLYTPTEAGRAVAAGTSILQVYEQAQRFLLILGEPGGGKTVTLLHLAQALLAQGAAPVFFNLASWARQQKSLLEWMQGELKLAYGIHPDLSAPLFKQQALIPLLDGLDEVAEAQRPACVSAINVFCRGIWPERAGGVLPGGGIQGAGARRKAAPAWRGVPANPGRGANSGLSGGFRRRLGWPARAPAARRGIA